jgi:hypothetical protein
MVGSGPAIRGPEIDPVEAGRYADAGKDNGQKMVEEIVSLDALQRIFRKRSQKGRHKKADMVMPPRGCPFTGRALPHSRALSLQDSPAAGLPARP